MFDFYQWKKHRSSSPYLRHIVGLGESRIVSRALPGLNCRSTIASTPPPLPASRHAHYHACLLSAALLALHTAARSPAASPLTVGNYCPHQPCPSTTHACPAPQVSGLMAPLSYVMTLSLAVACYNASAEVRGNSASSAARLTCPVACPLPARAPAYCTRPWHCPAPVPHSESAAHCSGPPARQLTHPPDLPTPSPPAPQAGYLPVFPELKLATNAPFGLTSFALSLLLVFR